MYTNDDIDDDSFCRVPARPQLTYRLPHGCTSSSISSDSAPYPQYDCSYDDDDYDDCEEDSNDSSSEQQHTKDCWGGSVLNRMLSLLITPTKNNALSYCEESIDQLPSDIKKGFESDDTCASPTQVQDFPLQPSSPLPCKQIFPDPPLVSHQDESEVFQGQDFQRRLCHQEDDSGSISPKHFLIEAANHEAGCSFDDAIASLEQYLSHTQHLSGTSFDHSRATTLHQLGILQWKCGRYFFSEHILLDCIHTFKTFLDGTNPYVIQTADDPESMHRTLVLESAHVLISLGRVYLSKDEGDSALDCYDECVRRLSSIQGMNTKSRCSSRSPSSTTPSRIFAQACVGAGRVLASQGRIKSSLKRYKRALKVQLGYQMDDPDSPVAREDIDALSRHDARVPVYDIAETLSHLGRLYEQKNDFDRSIECHVKALSFYRIVLDPYAVDIAYSSNNLGQLYLRLGYLDQAQEAFEMAYHAFSLRLGANHRNTAHALLSIGQLQASQGHHNKAVATFKRVLRAEPVYGELLGVTLHSIACSYEATFRIDKALKYYQREVNLRATLSPYHVNIARLLHHMAQIAMQAVDCNGDYLYLDQASNWLEEAAEIICEQNEGNSAELQQLESSIEDTRNRINISLNK